MKIQDAIDYFEYQNKKIERILGEAVKMEQVYIYNEMASKALEKQLTKEPILQAIQAERDRQDKKWGEQNHHPGLWTGILGEEYGELCEAINETVLLGSHSERGGYENMRKEAIHVAAVAVGFLECLERNREGWGI